MIVLITKLTLEDQSYLVAMLWAKMILHLWNTVQISPLTLRGNNLTGIKNKTNSRQIPYL